jgi:hypothetical protein
MEIILGQPKPVTIIKQEVKREAVLAPYQQFLNPYLNPWYLTSGYPNLSSTPVYSLWRPYRPFYYGYGQSGLYQPGYYGP